MRLIDANKLGLHFNDWQFAEAPNDKTGHEPKEYTSHDMQLAIYETIGEAMRGIDEAPTVEAIPTEWLLTTGMLMVDNDTRTKLFNLISLWRKENENSNSNNS